MLSNGISGCDIRTLGRAADNYEVPKCCDNIVKTPTQLNSPLNELNCVPRLRDGDMIECQFAACGCNFRASDRSQLIVHNEENIHRHMNVSVCVCVCVEKSINCQQKFQIYLICLSFRLSVRADFR